MALDAMTLQGKVGDYILGMSLGQAIMGMGSGKKKKKSLRLLMGIKKRKGYKRAHHHSKPVKLHRGKKKHCRRHHLKKHSR